MGARAWGVLAVRLGRSRLGGFEDKATVLTLELRKSGPLGESSPWGFAVLSGLHGLDGVGS